MRLLYVTAEMPYGTGESFFIPEVKEIVRRGHDVLVVPRSAPTDAINSAAQGVPTPAAAKPIISWQILIAALAEFVRAPIRTLRALAVVCFTPNPLTTFRNLIVFPKALWLARFGRTWKADHIHAHWASTMASMAMVAGEVSDIPWSFTAHRGDIVRTNLISRKEKSAAFVRYISQSGIELARERGAVAAANNSIVIHMGVVLPPPMPARVASGSPTNILCAGHLIPVKGHRCLLEAVQLLKQRGICYSLKIAGEGPLLGELQRLAKSLAVDDRVQFVGHVDHNDLLDLYREGKIGTAVLPSLDLGGGLHEGIPVALIEAMAYGVPVVSTNTGGIPELLHGGAGIMVAPNDPAALAEGLERAMYDEELRSRLAATGQRRVQEEFAIENVVSHLMDRIEATITRE